MDWSHKSAYCSIILPQAVDTVKYSPWLVLCIYVCIYWTGTIRCNTVTSCSWCDFGSQQTHSLNTSLPVGLFRNVVLLYSYYTEKDQINQFKNVLHFSLLCSRPYQVSVVGGAGALLGDPHAETGKAAVFVVLAEMEGARLAAGAGRTLHIHLQRHIHSIRSIFVVVVVVVWVDLHRLLQVTLQRHTPPSLQPSLPLWSQW